jgi:DUF2075 family protein
MENLTEKRANVLMTALFHAVYLLVHEHEFTRERIHELVDRALDA